jgi:hypothetical protein
MFQRRLGTKPKPEVKTIIESEDHYNVRMPAQGEDVCLCVRSGQMVRMAETEGFEPSIGLYNPITV